MDYEEVDFLEFMKFMAGETKKTVDEKSDVVKVAEQLASLKKELVSRGFDDYEAYTIVMAILNK